MVKRTATICVPVVPTKTHGLMKGLKKEKKSLYPNVGSIPVALDGPAVAGVLVGKAPKIEDTKARPKRKHK
jgi:hypothetical protein